MRETVESIELAEEVYLFARAELKRVFLLIVLGFGTGAMVTFLIFSGDKGIEPAIRISIMILMGLMVAGIPYVWKDFPYIALGWLSLLIKIFASLFIGWIAVPLALFLKFTQVTIYEGRLLRQMRREDPDEMKGNGNILPIICALICVVLGISVFPIGYFVGISAGNLRGFLLFYEIYIIISSFLWITYRTYSIIGVFDVAMDSITAWILRHIWVLCMVLFGKTVGIWYVGFMAVFGWDALILIDAVIYVIKYLVSRKRTV